MILIDKKWDESLLKIQYGDGYDIRIHGVQVALNLLSRRSRVTGVRMGKLKFGTIKFGYHDVETEDAIKAFQESVGIPVDGRLNRLTYEKIFQIVRNELNSVIVEVGEKQLKICEITKDLESLLPGIPELGENQDDGSNNENLNPGGGPNDNNINWGNGNLFDDGDIDLSDPGYGNWNDNFKDDFFNSLGNSDGDDIFYIFNPKLPDFSLDYGDSIPFVSRGHGADYTDINGYPNTGYGSDGNYSSDFVDGLLSNSIYKGNFDYERPIIWGSNSNMDINVDGFSYDTSEKYKSFFSDRNTSPTRKSGYDITIVYGPKGQFAKKIIQVIPRARSQQIDASGEAIFDVIEFVAKDVIETDNRRR